MVVAALSHPLEGWGGIAKASLGVLRAERARAEGEPEGRNGGCWTLVVRGG